MEFLPQELETWYILPALRKEFAYVLSSKHKMKQKDIAKILDVTEAAISQYMKNKRGKEFKFQGVLKQEIEKSAEIVAENNTSFSRELQRIFSLIRKEGHICKMHRKIDSKLPAKCDICFNG